MKRKTEAEQDGPAISNGQPEAKKRALSDETIRARFRDGLFEQHVLDEYKQSYAKSAP